MKLNKIFMALAAMAMVGCSSEDVMDFTANQAPEDSRMIQLDENFALAGVGEGDATTRTHWVQDASGLHNVFLPILTAAYAADDVLANDVDPLKQAVGLCWLGETAGPNVFTNYQFYHFGWLATGETEAKTECNKLTNGAWYDEIKFTTAGGTVGEEPTIADFAFVDPAEKNPLTIAGLNWNSGIYRTDNKAIFGGDYIVYYPFNEDFNEVGTIPAKAITSFDAATSEKTDTYLGDATFRYSNKIHIDGGAKASGFSLRNLSALVNLNVLGNSGGNIDQIILWSKKEQLLSQANLAADKILAGKTGEELYDDTKGTKTIVAKLKTPAASTATTPVKTYITVLPTTVEDLVAYVHRADGKWAKKTISAEDSKFEPASGKTVHINVSNSDFKVQYIAVDDASLASALGEARTAIAGGEPSAKIEVIGDITLKTVADIAQTQDSKITITGDAIIVPEDFALTLNTNMESDIIVKGKSCCTGAIGGRLIVNGGKISNVTMEKTEATVTSETEYQNYNPVLTYMNATADATVEVAAGKKVTVQAGQVVVGLAGTYNIAIQHKADFEVLDKDAKVYVSGVGDLNFMGATVVNNGTIEVLKEGKFDMTDANGDAQADDGKRMTNNGKFIHNVDAQVGTAVQLMNQNGEYRCKVDKQIKLDDAYQKWTACSVIEMVGAGQSYNLGVAEKNINYKHKGKFIDIEVNTTSLTTFSNPDLGAGDGDNKDIQVGKLTVMQGGLYVPFVTGEGKRSLTVNGDMTVSVTSSLYTSKMITVKENLIVNKGAELKYAGKKQNEGGLAVEKDITVSDAKFNAGETAVDALNITCANFTLDENATAVFGNRTEGDTKNLTVRGTIKNPAGCTFTIVAANQEAGSVLATITCTKLVVGGNFPGGKPQVVAK